MPATTTRQEARRRMMAEAMAALDRVIPADESKPLRGGTFAAWEDQADAFARTITTALLEERAALEDSAAVSGGGSCPHCGSERVYLKPQAIREEVRTPYGPVVLTQQRCRCRSCDRTFSPSGAGVGTADRGAGVAARGAADGAGVGDAALRQRGQGDQPGLGHELRRQADAADRRGAGADAGGQA